MPKVENATAIRKFDLTDPKFQEVFDAWKDKAEDDSTGPRKLIVHEEVLMTNNVATALLIFYRA